MGKADRLIRILAGLTVGILGIVFQSWWGLIGLLPLGTALFKFCPMYVPLKWDTSKGDK